MELKQQARLGQVQQLLMTPQLHQAIRILQLNRMELVEELKKELDGNPLLVEEPLDGRAPGDTRDLGTASTQGEETINRMEERRREDPVSPAESKAVGEIDWERFLENRTQQQTGQSRNFEDLPPIEQNLTKSASLVDHLEWQIRMSDLSEAELKFAALVIGNLDENGFLDLQGVIHLDGTVAPDITLDDLAEMAGLDPEDAPEVLRILQEMDPVGACSRNLQECLKVQAEVFGCTELEAQILDRHFSNLEKHNYQAIAKDLKASLEDVYEAVQEIQKLESRPARGFTDFDEKTIAITPDVYVLKEGDELIVRENDRGVQRLFINKALAEDLKKDKAKKEFISEKLRDAQWLLRALDERRSTILRVMECIVERQREFFEKGAGYLKPMTLGDIAKEVERHESTISRATTNKYVHTPLGVFELKYFFNASIRRVAEEDIASESVKQAIKQIIDGEDKSSPYSDQAIVAMLEESHGIQIARRTVAKYREMMGYLASSRRKKHF